MANPSGSIRPRSATRQAEIDKRNEASIIYNAKALMAGDLEGSVEGFSPHIVWESTLFPKPIIGRQAAMKALQDLLRTFPGISFDLQLKFFNGNYVILLWKVSGREINDFMGISHYKGKPFKMMNIVINQFNDEGERIAIWDCFAWGTILRQIGYFSGTMSSGQEFTGANASSSNPELPPGFQLPATFPPGVDPETYKLDLVERRLNAVVTWALRVAGVNQALMTPVRSGADLIGFDMRGSLSLLNPDLTIGARGHEPRRPEAVVGRLRAQLRFIPDEYYAKPGVVPPPTRFDPSTRQRFVLMNFSVGLEDKLVTLTGFGTGSTHPIASSGRRDLALTGIINFTAGNGQAAGREGVAVIDGRMGSGSKSTLTMVLRVEGENDVPRPTTVPGSRQTIHIRPERARRPESEEITLIFLGVTDPENPFKFRITPQGRFLGAFGHEILHLVRLQHSAKGCELQNRSLRGRAVSRGDFEVYFNPFAPESPHSFQTSNGSWTFFDRAQRVIGRLHANIVEGRAFATNLRGAPMTAFRVGGVAPILSGSGIFQGISGLITVNIWLSIFPQALSNVMLIQFKDRERRLLTALERAWA